MSELECIEFIKNYGIEIPERIKNSDKLGIITKTIIEKVCSDPNCVFTYNYGKMVNYAEAIRKVIIENYIVADSNDVMHTRYSLQYNTVQDSFGNWVTSGGAYISKWYNYNCYAYAIKRSENNYQYESELYMQYQPGDMTDDSLEPGAINCFDDCEDIFDLAELVQKDLISIGYTNIDLDYSLNQLLPISTSQELICVRMCDEDYHFMRYDLITNSWYHKPGRTAVLKYNYIPNNADYWYVESSYLGYEQYDDYYYDSDIVFIKYDTNSIYLNCGSTSTSSTKYIQTGKDVIYKVNIDCAKSYNFISSSSHPVLMFIYNYDMDLLSSTTPVMTNNKCTGTITTYLNPGIYYLRVRYDSNSDSGNITTSYQATWPSIGNEVYTNTNNNMMTHLHATINNEYHLPAYFTNTNGPGYYKFRLNAGSNVTYPAGAIRIYTDSNRQNVLNRYSINGINSNAISNYNENEMYVYLPDNVTYYIDIVMPNNNYNLLTLYIERSEINNFDYSNTLNYQSFTPLFENKTNQNYFEEVTISHRSKFNLDILTSGTVNSNIPVYIFQKVLEPGNEPGVYNCHPVRVSNSNWYISTNNSSPVFNIILEAGSYYIGYENNLNNVNISYSLHRVVDYETSSLVTLVTDPGLNLGYTLGSEVNFNGGIPFDTTITEGFTRCIYLMVDNLVQLPESRLAYDWYSSNNNVASVTHYGTVLARPVNSNTNVTIYAVLKDDPSVVLSIILTVLNDIETNEIEIVSNLSYSYSTQNGSYQLALDNSNSPYPWINYYIWEIDISDDYPNLEVEMNEWGYITSNGTGMAILTANYYLNPRVYLTIYLTINP